jgi:prepilin-type processing-associated H-X9-DG protein
MNTRRLLGDCLFAVVPSTWESGSFPDARHQNGANLAFADGHTDHWKWYEPNTIRISKLRGNPWVGWEPVTAGDRDVRRLKECIAT